MAAPPSSNPSPFGWISWYGVVLGLLLTGMAFWWSTPLMTGRLAAAHADFESQCALCHPPAGRSQDSACLACHPTNGTTSPSTLHRRHGKGCSSCHHEHRSREYPLRLDDPLSFDHRLTGFPLDRRHSRLECRACHRSGRPYYQVGRRCRDCHANWSAANFDHARQTGVALVRHATLACAECHPEQRYEDPPVCTTCHGPRMAYQPGQEL